MKHVILPDDVRRSLAFYLAMEEFVAREIEGEAFFVWRVEPTVIFGRNQVLENEVNLEYCREHGVDIVRRKSGGGCVYSDLGNIMVSYISRRGDVSEVFDRYMTALTEALRALGVPAEKSGRNDILVEGRKISGNAFHQLPDRSIVHGTLLYSTDLEALTEAIRPPVEKLQRHGVKSVRQRVMNLSEYVALMTEPDDALKSPESLEEYLVRYFTDGEIHLDENDLGVIARSEATWQSVDMVLALGGGAVMTAECAEIVHSDTICIYLKASVETLMEHLSGQTDGRPMLGDSDLRTRIEDLMALRSDTYEKTAHIIIDTDGKPIEAVASEIISIIREEQFCTN